LCGLRCRKGDVIDEFGDGNPVVCAGVEDARRKAGIGCRHHAGVDAMGVHLLVDTRHDAEQVGRALDDDAKYEV